VPHSLVLAIHVGVRAAIAPFASLTMTPVALADRHSPMRTQTALKLGRLAGSPAVVVRGQRGDSFFMSRARCSRRGRTSPGAATPLTCGASIEPLEANSAGTFCERR